MSWQRIDGDTYVDDTLITCAEYQLFIDEMRKQGKYYQPDHWTSYKFPKGQAREPILGVRHSDAVAFCDWLTLRGEREWIYRLPTWEEAANFPFDVLEQNILGYWINEEFQFAWIGSMPEDARGIDFRAVLASAFIQTRTRERVRDAQHDFHLDLEIQHAHDRALSRPLHLDIPFFERHSHFDNKRDFDRFLTHTLDQALELSILSKHIQDSARSVDRIRTLTRRLHLDRVLSLPIVPNINFNAPIYRMNPNRVLDLFFDTYTLRERIAGRSPAFEGIRLVKERK